MKATNFGNLNPVDRCTIEIPLNGVGSSQGDPNKYVLTMNNLPDITDTKSAVYNNEPIAGRSVPLYTYSHSGDRTISMQIHFFVVEEGDANRNLEALKIIQSAVYPCQDPADTTYPYTPPPVCKIKCGSLLASRQHHLCVVLQSYSVKFPTDVAWYDEDLLDGGMPNNNDHYSNRKTSSDYCPFRFDVDTTWLVVYSSEELPFQTRIIVSGR